MKTVKLFDGIEVETENGIKRYPDMDALDAIHIPQDNRMDIIRYLFAFHRMDLTQAYDGHKVIISLYNN